MDMYEEMNFMFEDNRIYTEDKKGKLLAEITFPNAEGNIVEIDHTYVDEALRGQGVADHLMLMAVGFIRMREKLVRPICPYAVRWFEKHTEQQDMLAP